MKISVSKSFKLIVSVFVLAALMFPQEIVAQNKKKRKKKDEVTTVAPKLKEKKAKKISDLVKSSKKIEGLFTVYQDTITGSLQMEIKEDQIEFINCCVGFKTCKVFG